MAFNEVKVKAIDCIKNGHVRHIERDIGKNMFAVGDFTPEEMILIIGACRGDWYNSRKHHFLEVDVHILKPRGKYDGLYIKFFFIEPDILFISVHESDYKG
ncbi:MAG: type II toxin-antitoxin system MqsR family toxin [Chitinispirillales bacterium]|nr:type II toxin-antitoxin system MqsR family toxin [Chitinispirillales bacterium]